MASFADIFGIGGITSIVDDIIKLIPNKNAEEQAQLQLQLTQMLTQREIDSSQSITNTAEAANESLFVAGWRPGIGWICATAFAWQFVVLPILLFINSEFHYTITSPVFDTSSMVTILMGMLGLGSMRSFDKYTHKKLNASNNTDDEGQG